LKAIVNDEKINKQMTDLRTLKEEGYFKSWIVLCLIVVPILVFWPATSFEFVWDDQKIHLSQNPFIWDGTLKSLTRLWGMTYKNLYIPMSYTVWSLVSQFGKHFDPFTLHLTNILIHTLNGLLVYILLCPLIKKPWAALAATLLFLIHPVQIETVAWVSEMRGLLSTCFGLIALHFYLRIPKGDRFFMFSALGVLFYASAIVSKPSAISWILLAFLFDIFLERRSIKSIFKSLLPWILVTIPILIVTFRVQVGSQNFDILSGLFIWSDAINFYLLKVIYPFSLNVCYGRSPDAISGTVYYYLSPLLPASIAVYLWKSKRARPLLPLSVLIFLIGFLPVSGLVPFVFQSWSTVADRYLYVSMIGVSVLFGFLLLEFDKFKSSLAAAVLLIVLFLGVRSHLEFWRNSLSLWNHSIDEFSQCANAYNERGTFYLDKKNHTLAQKDFRSAIKVNPRHIKAYYNLGTMFLHLQKFEDAFKNLNQAIALDPYHVMAFTNRGTLFAIRQEYMKALQDYTRAIELNPSHLSAYSNRGKVYSEMGLLEEALADFEQAIAIRPNYQFALQNKALLLEQIQKRQK